MDFSKWFKEKRKAAGLSQKEAGDIFDVATRTISSWETGENEPQISKRREIEEYFMRNEGVPDKEIPIDIDRSVIIEALLRNVLRQIAKERAARAGRPKEWKEYLREIDEDTVEEMNRIALKLGAIKD